MEPQLGFGRAHPAPPHSGYLTNPNVRSAQRHGSTRSTAGQPTARVKNSCTCRAQLPPPPRLLPPAGSDAARPPELPEVLRRRVNSAAGSARPSWRSRSASPLPAMGGVLGLCSMASWVRRAERRGGSLFLSSYPSFSPVAGPQRPPPPGAFVSQAGQCLSASPVLGGCDLSAAHRPSVGGRRHSPPLSWAAFRPRPWAPSRASPGSPAEMHGA